VTAATNVLGPKTAPDEVSIQRLRRVLADSFGEMLDLEEHLALQDSRGVRYATEIASS
jgi:hypothetical protein